MKKYRMYVASFSYLQENELSTVNDYVVTKSSNVKTTLIDGSPALREVVSKHATVEDAQLEALDVDHPIIVAIPYTPQRIYTTSVEFDTESAAYRWLESQVSASKHKVTGTNVETIFIDEDEIEDYEYHPTYTVEIEVKTIKRFEVEIDPDEVSSIIDDEFDAQDYAVKLAEEGLLDYEVSCAEEYDCQFEAVGCEEN